MIDPDNPPSTKGLTVPDSLPVIVDYDFMGSTYPVTGEVFASIKEAEWGIPVDYVAQLGALRAVYVFSYEKDGDMSPRHCITLTVGDIVQSLDHIAADMPEILTAVFGELDDSGDVPQP